MMKKMTRTLVACGFGLASLGAAAQADQVEVGQKAPPIEAKASDGTAYASSQVLSGDKRLVLIFFRGAW